MRARTTPAGSGTARRRSTAPRWGRAALAFASVALLLAEASCAPTVYAPVRLPTFRTRAPRAVVLDALVRRAAQTGYQLAAVDPVRGTFRVHARLSSLSRRSRRAQLRMRGLQARVTGDLLVVHVRDQDVQVSVAGPHVQGIDRPHPMLAAELAQFAELMRRAAEDVGRGLGSVGHAQGAVTPYVPPGYGGATPAPAGVSGYGPPPTDGVSVQLQPGPAASPAAVAPPSSPASAPSGPAPEGAPPEPATGVAAQLSRPY